MLSYQQALERLLSQVPPPRVIRASLLAGRGRVLAEAVRADRDLPPFAKAFMDGYALSSQDSSRAPVRLRVIGKVTAGSGALPQLEEGQAVQIMTGAPLPPGADAVQIVEKTGKLDGNSVEILEPVRKGDNIALQGDEISAGDTVLESGRIIGSAEIGVLATFGVTEVKVYAGPGVAIVSTGDEIVEIDQTPGFAQIRNSNAYTLWSQCASLGLETEILPVVPDDLEKTRQSALAALQRELILFTGGVSMGESDYVQQALREAGFEIFFHKVAIKPGKPILVGKKGDHLVFGLPGNPVSAFVAFELFVRPAVRKWMGFQYPNPQRILATLCREIEQKPGRMFFRPARTCWSGEGFQTDPVETRGSADLVAFSRADSLLIMGQDVSHIPAGAEVEVILLEAYFARAGEL